MLTIRPAVVADKPRVLDMLTRVWEDDYLPEIWETWVQRPNEGVVLVAEHGGQMAGTCYLRYLPNHIAWFQAMRVDPNCRRLGIGSALTRTGLTEAQKAQVTHVYLGIDADNTASLRMTAECGFKEIMRYERVTCTIPTVVDGSVPPSTWRKAVPGDLDELVRLEESASPEVGVFAHWQWHPTTREAIAHQVESEHIWVWGEDKPQVWAGLGDFGDYVALFPPRGQRQAVAKAVDELLASLPRQKDVNFEAWLIPGCPLLNHLRARGLTGDDGYTIWGYELEPIKQTL